MLGSQAVCYDRVTAHTDVAICLAKKPTSAKELYAAVVNFEWMVPLANTQFEKDSHLRSWAEKCFAVYQEITA